MYCLLPLKGVGLEMALSAFCFLLAFTILCLLVKNLQVIRNDTFCGCLPNLGFEEYYSGLEGESEGAWTG